MPRIIVTARSAAVSGMIFRSSRKSAQKHESDSSHRIVFAAASHHSDCPWFAVICSAWNRNGYCGFAIPRSSVTSKAIC